MNDEITGIRNQQPNSFMEAAQANGWELIGFTGSKQTPISARCRVGHERVVRPDHLVSSKWRCPACERQKTVDRWESKLSVALSKTGASMVDGFNQAKNPITIRCQHGHETSDVPYLILNRGFACDICSLDAVVDLRQDGVRHRRGQCGPLFLKMAGLFNLTVRGECRNAKDLTDVICRNGHIFATSIEKMRNVIGNEICHVCRGENRIMEQKNEFHKTISANGGKVVGQFTNAKDGVLVECSRGHSFEADLYHLRWEGFKCGTCRSIDHGEKNNTFQRGHGESVFQSKVKDRGGIIKGVYISAQSETDIECGSGHIFKMSLSRMMSTGDWCPTCARDSRLTPLKSKFLGIINEKSWSLVSEYDGTAAPVTIKCDSGHTFVRRPYDFINHPHRKCPVCWANEKKCKGADRFNNVVVRRGGIMIGEYVDAKTKVKIACEMGHEFNVDWGHMHGQGTWCPECACSVFETKVIMCCRHLTGLLLSDDRRPEWLSGQKSLDAYDASAKVAVEADGVQHAATFNPFERNGLPNHQKTLDSIKDSECNGAGVSLLRVPYMLKSDDSVFLAHVKHHAMLVGEWRRLIEVHGDRGAVDLASAYRTRSEELRSLECTIAGKNTAAKLLTPYRFLTGEIQIFCGIVGHDTLVTNASAVIRGTSWCRKCSFMNLSNVRFNEWMDNDVLPWSTRHGVNIIDRDGNGRKQSRALAVMCKFGHETIMTVGGINDCIKNDRLPCGQCRETEKIRAMGESWPQFIVSRSVTNDREWRFECRRNSTHVFHGTVRMLELQSNKIGFDADLGTPCPECQGFISARVADTTLGSSVDGHVTYKKNPRFSSNHHREQDALSLIRQVYPNASILLYSGLTRDGTYSCGIAGHDPVTTKLQYVADKKPGSLCRTCHPSVTHGRWDLKRANAIAADNASEIGAPTESAKCLTSDGEVSARGTATWMCGVRGHKPFLASPDNLRRRKGKAGGWCSSCWLARCERLGIKRKRGRGRPKKINDGSAPESVRRRMLSCHAVGDDRVGLDVLTDESIPSHPPVNQQPSIAVGCHA